ncbi:MULTISPECIES: transcriptional repressor LexA [Clostridia]|jgi:repressor LexA|uniref:LexA repressor n=2 Tax=Coprococcus TaxID=33042 RepID=A0A8I0AI13_9FIRM|nr:MULTISPECIES: transcriptional repressor LexA [Clostridia]MDD6464947.1 transcriptional repressor LexA [Coprococcus sp.]RGH10638.1 transcriptional repressor LexA [Clostridium sp. AF15-31]RHV81530.1 transcriptional repressor LexA [Clostridium sp. OF10-22XD]UEA75553.1 transcriptional repressor LexA [Lachnospiraceae bacterium GAM79]CCY61702.1 lexA repressor [Clostridium sp. CAG:264]
MGKEKLTDKQTQILEYIRHEILAKGYPPSIREICQAVDLKSTSSVHAQLSSLEAKGYIRRDLTKSRSIEIIDDDFSLTKRELVNIPIVGTVSCGQPILAEQNIEDYFPVPPEYIHNTNNQTFMLRVKGDSMINVGIYEKDLVIVEQCSSARNGEIVVALIEDSATVKTFYKENGYIRLQPENDYMDPILVEHCEILGRVIGLFRNFI